MITAKAVPPNGIGNSFVILSRIKNEAVRAGLEIPGPGWMVHTRYNQERHATADLEWLVRAAKAGQREYMLFVRLPPEKLTKVVPIHPVSYAPAPLPYKPTSCDALDDDLPASLKALVN